MKLSRRMLTSFDISIEKMLCFQNHSYLDLKPCSHSHIELYSHTKNRYEEDKIGIAIHIYSHENHRYLSQHHSSPNYVLMINI